MHLYDVACGTWDDRFCALAAFCADKYVEINECPTFLEQISTNSLARSLTHSLDLSPVLQTRRIDNTRKSREIGRARKFLSNLKCICSLVHDEIHGSSFLVLGRRCQLDRHFNHPLVSPLHAAIALPQVHDVVRAVPHDLQFKVAGPFDELSSTTSWSHNPR